jgi:hypothetical protein
MVVDKARLAAFAVATTAVGWAIRAYARRRQEAERLLEEERAARRKAEWDAGAPERERRRLEAEQRERERLDAFLAAGAAKHWRYEIVGECHLDRHKKRFPTELDAQIFTWKQHQKHGGPLQRAYQCDGSDTPDNDGCGSWHLTSKAAYS